MEGSEFRRKSQWGLAVEGVKHPTAEAGERRGLTHSGFRITGAFWALQRSEPRKTVKKLNQGPKKYSAKKKKYHQ